MTAEARRVALETGAVTVIECWGDAGPAILCVHDAGGSRGDFARLGASLASTHRVFAYDQRGHGDAETAGPRALDVLGADLRAVADSIGTVAAVVGHAWGGAVALVAGPKIARTLVLIDPTLTAAPGSFEHGADGWDLRARLDALKRPPVLLSAGDEPDRFAEAVRDAVPA